MKEWWAAHTNDANDSASTHDRHCWLGNSVLRTAFDSNKSLSRRQCILIKLFAKKLTSIDLFDIKVKTWIVCVLTSRNTLWGNFRRVHVRLRVASCHNISRLVHHEFNLQRSCPMNNLQRSRWKRKISRNGLKIQPMTKHARKIFFFYFFFF